MFLGVISWRSGSPTCWRRHRLRSAIATERLARCWPMMCLSSSWTISCGVMEDMIANRKLERARGARRSFEHFHHRVLVGVDADVRRDRERLAHDLLGRQRRIVQQRPRRRLRVGAARAERYQAELGLEHVAHAGDHQRSLAVGDAEHRLEPAQHAVGAPVLRELDRRAKQVALVLLELGLEALEERERVRGAAREPGEDAVVVQPAHLARARLDDDVAESHLAVAAERDLAVAPDAEDGGAVELLHEVAGWGGREAEPRASVRDETRDFKPARLRHSFASAHLRRMTVATLDTPMTSNSAAIISFAPRICIVVPPWRSCESAFSITPALTKSTRLAFDMSTMSMLFAAAQSCSSLTSASPAAVTSPASASAWVGESPVARATGALVAAGGRCSHDGGDTS